MPNFGGAFEYVPEVTSRSAAPTQEEASKGAQLTMPGYHSTLATVGGAALFALPDLADTVLSSVGLQERDQLNQGMMRAIDMPGLERFRRDIVGSTEMASGVAGVIGAELIARKVTAPAGFVMKGLSKTPYFARIAALDAQYARAMETVRNVDMSLAKTGTLGREQFIGMNRANEALKARGLGAAVAVRNAAVTEGIMGVTLNENSMLYTDSAAWNTMFVGLGLAIPASAEWLFAGYRMRKAASADELIRAQVGALDPYLSEEKRLTWLQSNKGLEAGASLHGFGGAQTDEVTSLLIESQQLKSAPTPTDIDPRALASNRDKLSTQKLALAREKIASVTTKGLSHDGRTRFTIGNGTDGGRVAGAPGYANHINELMNRDPSSLYLVEQMGGLPDGISAHVVHEQWTTRLEERVKETEAALADPKIKGLDRVKLERLQLGLREEQRQTMGVIIDAERLPMSEAAVIEGFEHPKPHHFEFIADANRLDQKGPQGTWAIKRPTNQKATLATINHNLDLQIHGKQSLDNLDHYDYLRMYRLGDRVASQLAASKAPIELGANPNWFQLDLAEEVLKRSDGTAQVLWPKGLNRESAQVESFAQKAELLRKKSAELMVASNTGKAGALNREQQMARLRVQLNMPRTTAYEMGVTGSSDSGAMSLLRGAGNYGPDEIRKMSLVDLKTAVAEFQRLGDMAPVTAKDIKSLQGNSFTYMLDRNGQEMKPILVTMRPAQRFEWVSDNVAERVATNQAIKRNILLNESADEYTRLIAQSMFDNPDAIMAANTHEIRGTQMMGSVTGSAPGSTRGAFSNAVTTSEFAVRDAPVILAAGRVRDTVDRLSGGYVTKVFSDTFETSLNQLANPRNAKSVMLLDQFHSTASGWDLLAKPEKMAEDGLYGFRLGDTTANRQRWKTQFGEEMPEGAMLRNHAGTTVVLDELGLDVQNRFNVVTSKLIAAKNTLLRSQGMREINMKPWYVPSPNIQGKHVGFVYGPEGKPVPGLSIVASTQEEYAKKELALQPELDKLGLGYTVRSMDDIQRFSNIWDKSIAEMMDPGTTAIQPGKKARGLMQERLPSPGSFSRAMENMRSQFLAHGRDIIETQYDSSIKAAQQRSRISDATKPQGRGLFGSRDYKNEHDIYIESLLGRSKIKSDKSFFGAIYNGAEGVVDGFLKAATPSASRVWTALTGWGGRVNPFSDSMASKKDFESLSKALGQYMPFESHAQLIEAKGYGARPWTHQEMAGKMNNFAATMVLRILDASHAMVNLGGLVAAMPAVIRHHSPRVGESVEAFSQRIGHLGMVMQIPDRGAIGVVDHVKLTKRGIQAALNPKNHEVFDDLVKRGMLSQEIAELHKQYGLINGRKGWQNFFLGDAAIENPKGMKERFQSKGVVGWMSALTDKSENFTRTIATMTGYELAKDLGIVTKEARLSFAHDVANKVIANYSPANRPEVFQGALGTSIGLFQSFIQNYYQRLFRYVETKDWAALRDQYVWQGSVFGLASVPGWATLNSAYANLSEDHGDATAEMRKRTRGASDLLEGGALSNLPTLFGGPAVDFYSRGDVNARMPGAQLFESQTVGEKSAVRQMAELAPIMSVMGKVYDGIGQGIAAFGSANPELTSTQLGEIASNMMPNRPIAGIIEQVLAGGNDTDRFGQLVAETQGAMEMTYRIMGVRSMRQSKEIEQFYAEKVPQQHKAALDYQLRVSSRAAIRAGQFDSLYDVFQNKYIENGGDPRYFRRWVKEQYEAATETRAERQLESALKNPARAAEATRYLEAGVPVGDDQMESALDAYGSLANEDVADGGIGLGDYPNQLSDPSLTQPPN